MKGETLTFVSGGTRKRSKTTAVYHRDHGGHRLTMHPAWEHFPKWWLSLPDGVIASTPSCCCHCTGTDYQASSTPSHHKTTTGTLPVYHPGHLDHGGHLRARNRHWDAFNSHPCTGVLHGAATAGAACARSSRWEWLAQRGRPGTGPSLSLSNKAGAASAALDPYPKVALVF